MSRITETVQSHGRDALWLLAEHERRDPRAQAALILREELERRGLLQPLGQIGSAKAGDRPNHRTQGRDTLNGHYRAFQTGDRGSPYVALATAPANSEPRTKSTAVSPSRPLQAAGRRCSRGSVSVMSANPGFGLPQGGAQTAPIYLGIAPLPRGIKGHFLSVPAPAGSGEGRLWLN